MFRLDRGVKRALELRERALRRQARPARAGQARADRRQRLLRPGRLAAPGAGRGRADHQADAVEGSPADPGDACRSERLRLRPQEPPVVRQVPGGRGHCYELRTEEFDHKFHSELPASSVWSYNGAFGGPVLDVRYGTPVCLQLENELPADHKGYGQPETTSHLHNFHTATESDGGPWNWLKPGQHRYQHYCMTRAGFTDPRRPPTPTTRRHGLVPAAPGGRPTAAVTCARRLTTLFFHDHRPEFTAPNLYKGLFMMVRAFDQDDTGDETRGWSLPSGKYDVPLMFQDKQIRPDSRRDDLQPVRGRRLPGRLPHRQRRDPALSWRSSRAPTASACSTAGRRGSTASCCARAAPTVKFDQITESGNLLPRAAGRACRSSTSGSPSAPTSSSTSARLPTAPRSILEQHAWDARRRPRREGRQAAQPGRPGQPAAQVHRPPEAACRPEVQAAGAFRPLPRRPT